MDFALQWHQRQIQETARAFLAGAADLPALRAAAAGEPGFSEETHRRMGELGWLSLGVSAPGAEPADAVDVAVFYEELGRAALPGPHTISALVAPLLIGQLKPDRKDLVDRLTSGTAIATVALYEEDGHDDPEATRTWARRQGGGWLLEGAKAFVPYAAAAESILVLARFSPAPGEVAFFEVTGDAPGMRLQPLEVISGERQHLVTLAGVRLEEGARLGGPGDAEAALRGIRPVVTLAQSAELLGLAQAAMEIAVQYAKDRVAFGHPIGSYQAIQHKCAEMLADVDATRFLVYQAACLVNSGAGTDPRVAMTKAFAAGAARRVTKEAHQILAGAGYLLDHRLNFYYRRAKGLEADFGDVNHQLDLVADHLLGAVGARA